MTSTFDRRLVLTEQGVDNLIALMKKWEQNPPPPIEPISVDLMEDAEVNEMLKEVFSSDG